MKNVRLIMALSVVVLLVVGTVLYYTWPNLVDESDRPPELTFGGNNLQGLMKKPGGFLEFTDEEIKKATECKDKTVEVAAGTHFYYLESKTSLDKVLKMLNPVKDARLLFAFYSPGETSPELKKGFHVYPDGGKTNNTVADPVTFEIPAYRAFVLHSTKATKFCGAADLIKTEKQPSAKMKLLKSGETGWIAVPALKDVTALTAAWASDDDRIKTVWFQSADNSFKKGDLKGPKLFEGYYMIWIYLDEEESVS